MILKVAVIAATLFGLNSAVAFADSTNEHATAAPPQVSQTAAFPGFCLIHPRAWRCRRW